MRFTPIRTYSIAAAVAFGLAAFSAWCAMSWHPAAVPAFLFLVSGILVALLAFQAPVEISEKSLFLGKRRIDWRLIRRLDSTGWVSPMVIYLTLADGTRRRLIYPGDVESSQRLMRMMQQRAYLALIDGVPHSRIFGEPEPAAAALHDFTAPKYQVLNADDQAEVERLYHRLRTAGHLDSEK
jgi:hypothetical protein